MVEPILRAILFLTGTCFFFGSYGLAPLPCRAQTETTALQLPAQHPESASPLNVQFGLGNSWKLGHLVPVRIQLTESLRSAATSLEIDSIDGDGVAMIYSLPIEAQSDSGDRVLWIPIRIGREFANLTLRVLGKEGLLYTETFDTEATSQVLPSAQPLVIALGASMGIEALNRLSADGHSSTFSTIVLTQPSELPVSWSDYSSCDLIVISGENTELLKKLSDEQWSAIETWIRRGGACILSLGEEASELASIPQLASLFPGKVIGTGRITNPAAVESLVATDEPLDAFACCVLQPERGRIELTLSDSLARPIPWWLSYSLGLGTMRFIASDLGEPAFDDWQDRQRLWGRLIAPYLDRGLTEAIDEKQVGESSYLGYNDLVGQLRATLDVFPEVGVISFGQVAAMLVGVLLLIGPIDYFVSVKWLKRPDLSWYFAGAMLLAITVGLTWLLSVIRPTEVHVNTAQVIDVDVAGEVAQGKLWSHIYSGSARELDVSVHSQSPHIPVRVDWQGLPGLGLGGLLSQLSTDRGMPTYTIAAQPNGQTTMLGVGIPAAGTKCLVANWMQPFESQALSNLREIPGVDQLEGELSNPLDVDLLDPVLFYHNWFYSLDSRILAGKSTTISFDTIPKDITRRLNGRHTVDGNESTIKWDPANRDSIDRLLELMMFYKSASGLSYTKLAHRYQPQVDQSNLLQTDRAILMGRLEQAWGQVTVTSSAQRDGAAALEIKQNLDRVWCRIAIPVKQNTKK